MIVSCMQCQMKFKVDDAKIGPRGVKVRCIRCQTMIIVKPSTDVDNLLPDVINPAEQEAPTRVHTLDPAARAALEQAAKRAEQGSGLRAVGGSFGLDQGPASDSLPPLPAFAEEEPLDRMDRTVMAPPPLPLPPPLKKPPLAQPAPPVQQNEDLFASPFGSPQGDRFMDAGNEGPALELDGPPTSTVDTSFDSLPRFDTSDDVLEMHGGMSAEGMVTRPVQVNRLEAEAADSSMALVPDPSMPQKQEAITVSRSPAKVAKNPRSALVRVGQVMMAAFILSGYAGLYLLWQAGGLDAFFARTDLVQSGALALQHVAIAPFVAADGTTFWVVRGEAQNTSSAAVDAARVKVTLQGHSAVSVALGAEPDATKLFQRAEIVQSKDPLPLQPDQSLPFTAVIPAVGTQVPGVQVSSN